MRTPKHGDRCEYAVFNQEKYRKERVCQIRHLSGAPPRFAYAGQAGTGGDFGV